MCVTAGSLANAGVVIAPVEHAAAETWYVKFDMSNASARPKMMAGG